MVSEVSLSGLQKLVSEERKTAFVLFWGDWCPDCTAFRPIWSAWSKGRKGPIYEVEVEKGGNEWTEWGLDEIPTVALFIEGSENERADGAITSLDLDELWALAEKKVLKPSRRGSARGQR